MRYTFVTLASILTVCLIATMIVGFVSFFTEDSVPYKDDIYLIHFSLGLATALVVLLVHCLIFTYFLGTGRWVKEVAIAYRLPDEQLPKLTRELKRSTFPPALYAMLIVIATAAAGAGARARLEYWPWYLHMVLAFLTLAINIWAFRIEYCNLCTNSATINAVLAEVDRIRAERGLPSNAEAIEQERRLV